MEDKTFLNVLNTHSNIKRQESWVSFQSPTPCLLFHLWLLWSRTQFLILVCPCWTDLYQNQFGFDLQFDYFHPKTDFMIHSAIPGLIFHDKRANNDQVDVTFMLFILGWTFRMWADQSSGVHHDPDRWRWIFFKVQGIPDNEMFIGPDWKWFIRLIKSLTNLATVNSNCCKFVSTNTLIASNWRNGLSLFFLVWISRENCVPLMWPILHHLVLYAMKSWNAIV